MEWMTAHYSDVMQIVLGVLGVFSVVARLTPNEHDNKVIDTVYRLVNFIGLTKK